MRIANFISHLFHPIYAPLWSLGILYSLPIYLNYRFTPSFSIYLVGIFFLNLVLAPLLITLYLKKTKLISSLEMENVQERTLPYLISCIYYCFTYFLLLKIDFPFLYLAIFRAATIALFLLLIFSLLKWKVSAHMTAMSGILGMLVIISYVLELNIFWMIAVVLIISGIIASARYQLGAHNFKELFAGFLLGFFTQYSLLFF